MAYNQAKMIGSPITTIGNTAMAWTLVGMFDFQVVSDSYHESIGSIGKHFFDVDPFAIRRRVTSLVSMPNPPR